MKFTVSLMCLGILSVASFGQNPVPFVNQPLLPTTVAPGSPAFTLTVNGTGFVPGSVVNWNGSSRTTTFVSGSQLTASIAATDVAVAGTAIITVSSPSPGGGVSSRLYLSITEPNEALAFGAPSFVSGGNGIVAADFNNDGKMDVAFSGEDSVGVQLGNGDSTFQPVVFYSPGPTDENCDYIVAADVNADGFMDLLVLDAETKNISVLLNNGDGTFKAAALYSTSATSPPQSFAMGDFNGDGFLDIAVPDLDEERVAIMLGGPNGTFGSGQLITCCFTPEWIGAGDFNGDGILDLVVIENFINRVEVLLGAGDGTFPIQIITNTPEGLYKLLVADFNGDGKLDIAGITNNEDVLRPSVSVLLGNGDGTFQQPVEYPVGNTPNGLALGDMDGDGKLDILAGNSQDSTTSLLLGNGDGTFQAQRIILPQLSGSFGIVTADFNGDGRPDFANLAGASVQTIPFGLSHASLLFPVQMVGTTSSSQSVTVTNTTNSSVPIIDIGVLGAKPFDFPETNDCPASLGAGAQCTITVSFKPTAKNDCSAYVTIYFGTGPNTETIALDGTGTVVSFSASQLDFGVQAVGTRSGPMSFTLTNKGAHALTVSSIVIAGANATEFAEKNNCGSSVASGGACTVTAFFTPKASGHRSAYIRIDDNGGGSPQQVTLSGIGR